jgi:hypothetical protein
LVFSFVGPKINSFIKSFSILYQKLKISKFSFEQFPEFTPDKNNFSQFIEETSDFPKPILVQAPSNKWTDHPIQNDISFQYSSEMNIFEEQNLQEYQNPLLSIFPNLSNEISSNEITIPTQTPIISDIQIDDLSFISMANNKNSDIFPRIEVSSLSNPTVSVKQL